MEFKKRDLLRNDSQRLKNKVTIVEDIDTDYFTGKICLIKMIEVDGELYVDNPLGKVKIMDNGFSNLIIAPRNKNWWLTVMYDNEDNYIESYFDITRSNNFECDIPYFIDLKLDVCIPDDYNAYLLDEEELMEAYDCNAISKEEYEMAYNTARKIIEFYNSNKESYLNFIKENYEKLNSKIKKGNMKI